MPQNVALFCRDHDLSTARHTWKEGEPMEAILASQLPLFLDAGFAGRLRTQVVCMVDDPEVELELRRMILAGHTMPRIGCPWHTRVLAGHWTGQSPWRVYFDPAWRADRDVYKAELREIEDLEAESRALRNEPNKTSRAQIDAITRDIESKRAMFEPFRARIERPLIEGKDCEVRGTNNLLRRMSDAILLKESRARTAIGKLPPHDVKVA